jgi:hypothetical protein
MLLELARPLSFIASMLSLYPVLVSAFFVPGSHWEERLGFALLYVALAACICFASGILFAWPVRSGPESAAPDAGQGLLSTLPVRLFFWAMTAMAILFAVSWYLEEYYLPLLRHDCCRP